MINEIPECTSSCFTSDHPVRSHSARWKNYKIQYSNALIIYNACKTHSRNRNPNHTHDGSHSSHHKWTIITTIKNNKHDIRTMC